MGNSMILENGLRQVLALFCFVFLQVLILHMLVGVFPLALHQQHVSVNSEQAVGISSHLPCMQV